MPKRILVSACLVGESCAYDGKARTCPRVTDLCERFGFVPVCPEMAGGMASPRETHEITGGDGNSVLDGRSRVLSSSGKDVTEQFIAGAKIALEKASKSHIKAAVMKSRSPSCGKYKIYSGEFNGTLRDGSGVTSALLKRHNIKVFTEEETIQAEKELSFL